jgi:hypothetical protein
MYVLIFILISFFDSSPNENIIIEDSSDIVEINHVYEINDKKEVQKRFVQIIWWEWRNTVLLPEKNLIGEKTGDWYSGSDFVVKDYRITYSRGEEKVRLTPYREKDRWISLFYDESDKCVRKVMSNSRIVTHTLYDREVKNREIVKQDLRNRLTKPDTNVIMREIEELIDADR